MDDYEQAQQPISKKLLAFNLLLTVAMISGVFIAYSTLSKSFKKESLAVLNTSDPSVFDNLTLNAKSAYVFDVRENKVIYKKNEFVQLPLASITKLMMALTATEIVPSSSHVIVKKEFLKEEGDTGLLADESWTLKDLLDFSLTVSSNDGARSIASIVGAFDLQTDDYDLGRKDFITKMNIKAQELGLKQTYFVNESGLDEGGVSGGYGSAIDIAKLMEYILKNHPDIVDATRYETINVDSLNKTHTAKNTNTDVNSIPGLIASKTGYTEMAGGNLVIAFDSSMGRPIIVVVLGSTPDGRFTDVSALVDATLAYIRG